MCARTYRHNHTEREREREREREQQSTTATATLIARICKKRVTLENHIDSIMDNLVHHSTLLALFSACQARLAVCVGSVHAKPRIGVGGFVVTLV